MTEKPCVKSGCGRKLKITFEGQAETIHSHCGLMNILCYDCKASHNAN